MAPLTNAEKAELKTSLLAQLASTPFACTSLLELTNGTTNFVFRGQLQESRGANAATVIIKHTTGYAAANKDFAIDVTRSRFEETMLDALKAFQNESGHSTATTFTARAPELLWFNRETNTQVLQDFADAIDLKASLLASAADKQHPLSSQKAAHSVGYALGEWLHSFHAWTAAPEQVSLRDTVAANEPMRKLKHQITYDALVRIVSPFDVAENDLAVLKEVQASAVVDFQRLPHIADSSHWGIIHGDFWSGNVLLPSDLKDPRLFVVDWEFAQYGHRAYDVGQLIGDLLERDHFRGAKAALDILAGFSEGYGLPSLSKKDRDLLYRTAIHAGVHLICSMIRRAPSGPLPGTQEQVGEAIRLGVNLIVRGWTKDEEWFKSSVFKPLFST
ncbi:phosphotransferase enzyme family protein [Ophiostoma piceae UAMH 11346]|uniref:Phosphotransferase enzyme family protein n=1 Tax=Ophiostoma piceae (strain UAMH 11346) TaxID=1262450 RepID=S3BPJ1_OPHP1|nr:phosphotransferase enzyme family protein [Ophiostoma piceae UAMH 11346]